MSIRNQVVREAYKKGYRVSDCGCEVSYKGRIRKLQTQTINGKNYHRFSVRYGKRSLCIYVHRLQAFQKFGSKSFQDKIVVRHKNDNSLDNSKKNILLGTQLDNMKDKYKNRR